VLIGHIAVDDELAVLVDGGDGDGDGDGYGYGYQLRGRGRWGGVASVRSSRHYFQPKSRGWTIGPADGALSQL
jgi:hypothetical protein